MYVELNFIVQYCIVRLWLCTNLLIKPPVLLLSKKEMSCFTSDENKSSFNFFTMRLPALKCGVDDGGANIVV